MSTSTTQPNNQSEDYATITADLVFVSDVHMLDMGDSRARLLMSLIKKCMAGDVKNFVLGGDIFEFLWARSTYFSKKFEPFVARLKELSESGTNVYFVQGNHEYCMEEISWDGVKILEADGTTLEVNSGGQELRIGISHGDLLNAPEAYLKFKSILNSGWFKFFFTMIPSFLADKFALNMAHQSRKKDKYRSLPHDDILGAAFKRAKREGENIHLFGHFHYPYQSKDIDETKVLCVPSWDIPNALVLNEGEFKRLNLKKDEIRSAKTEFKNFP